jgi:5-methylcytosine-specific restriction endonuclease McrA
MGPDVDEALRLLVAERAAHRCEYCFLPQAASPYRHELDHIVPQLHGGGTHERNLPLACLRCNRYKGPNIASFDPVSGALVALFNPRRDTWAAHFAWDGPRVQPVTPEGRVTVRVLRLNDQDRVAERRRLFAR